MSVRTPAVGDYRWHRRAWRRWSGRHWALASYSAFPQRLNRPREWATYPELSLGRRERLLEIAVDLEVLGGGTVVNRSARGVTISRRRPVTHLGHFILTIVTGGLWAVVWLAVILDRREDRVRYEVDPWGNIWPVTSL